MRGIIHNIPERDPKKAAVAVFATAALVLAVYLVSPYEQTILPPCYFHAITGLHCPGCGSTRAAHEILHGNFERAVHNNIIFVVGLPVALYFSAWFIGFHLGSFESFPEMGRNISIAVAIGLLLFGILRNLPFEPFTWLAPLR